MKYLILGAGSFAGQALFSEFLNRGYEVYGINRSSPKDHFQWPWIRGYEKKILNRWFKFSLTKSLNPMISKIKELDPEVIIDFMGQGMVAPSWKEPDLWYFTNVSCKAKLLNSFLGLNNLTKYIRISTPEVYGSSKKYITEDHFFNPSTPYAVSHAAIDYHIRCMGSQYKFPYLIGRFANFYGVGQQLFRIIPRIFLSCKTKKPFILDGKGNTKRSFIYSDDIISAIDSMCNFKGILEEFNFSSNEEISIVDLLERICSQTKINKNEILSYGPERPGKDLYYRLNISKSRNLLNWAPRINLDNGLKKVNVWISENQTELSNRSWFYSHVK